MRRLGELDDNSTQRRVVYSALSLCPTLTAAMGGGGGNIPMIIEIQEISE